MYNGITQYKKQLRRKLHCNNATKTRLMRQFDNTLNIYLDDHGGTATCLSEEDLHNAFGPPEEMAEILLTDTTSQERTQYRKSRLVTKVLITFIIAALAFLTIYIWFIKNVGITSVDDVGPVENPKTTYIESGDDNS